MDGRGRTGSAEGVEMKASNGNGPSALLAGAEMHNNAPTLTPFQQKIEQARKLAETIGENGVFASFMSVVTIYTLYQSDIRLAATDKDADYPFMVVASIIFFLFLSEILLQSFYKPDYCVIPDWEPLADESWTETWLRRLQIGSFYFWLDWIATITLIFDIDWILGSEALGAGGNAANAASAARSGARAGRVIRLVRMVRLIRMIKVYKYVMLAYAFISGKEMVLEEDDVGGSRVGAAMSDLTNRRVIVLILLMLIVIPLLTVNDADMSTAVAASVIHNLAYLAAGDPATYQSGLDLAVSITKAELPLVMLVLDGVTVYFDSTVDHLRVDEKSSFTFTTSGYSSNIVFDQKYESVQNALYSIYTTSFVIALLLIGIYFFSTDVNRLVIGPIERLVELVRKISANPLGVEYKMLGEKDGFVEGMETTVLLTTITKIGALMRVGFGEAGASVIAKNLSESSGGKLNLMGSGTMINSIFGFCDVRQFTDTTECLQEEVMLFVNRIAHILHNIVVQCSGAANKNIGDAFLLTWKIDEKLSPEQVSSLADQALLTFCKALIELSRYQEFICNFSMAATARLLKRFPDYAVRIGSGLHVGWAIEGAIGSNRKIDASYLSPHVGATEFLESSTKTYGVSLLMSEPFVKLLSPASSKYIRQVDRIRRSQFEDPMGLYTYDMDLSINWNDPYRHSKKDPKARLADAAKKALALNKHTQNASQHDPGRRGTNTHSSDGDHSQASIARKQSKDYIHAQPAVVGGLPGIQNPHHHQPHGSNGNINAGRKFSVLKALPVQPEEANDEEAPDADVSAQKAKETPTIVVPPYTQQVWTEDQDLIDLRHKVNDVVRGIWNLAMDAYILGDWEKCTGFLEETLLMTKHSDGPAKQLLGFIREHNGVAPANWQGYRMDDDGGH